MEYSLQSFLERLGLTSNEQKLYHAALELGESTPSALAKRARIHRVASYALIDNLVHKGLLTETSAGHGKKVSPVHPRKLDVLIKKEYRRIKKLELKYDELLPELSALYAQASVHPRVEFYEGIKGLEMMNQGIIDTLKDLPPEQRITYSYSNPQRVHELFEDYVEQEGGYVDKRKQYGIHNKVIALDGPLTQEIEHRDEEELREMITLPRAHFPFKNDITIYANKMAVMALENELIGVVIESKEIIDDQLAIFELAWRGAQTLSHESGSD